MSLWTSTEAEKATSGRATKDWKADGISIDTRTLKKGDLFIALMGEANDGHNYVAEAFKKGAAAAVVTHVPDDAQGQPMLIVPDTFKALENLGRAARERTGATIIAVTGSVGKTSTKEMLSTALGALGQAHASGKSFNNMWGVPMSLAGMHAGTDYGIFEIGMNHAGEIIPLTQQVRPNIAIITTIAPVHMEFFPKGEEGIADAKAEIFEGMKAGVDAPSMAILNRDNEWFSHLKSKAEALSIRVYSFGEHEKSDACMLECVEASNGSRIKARVLNEEISFTLKIAGRHVAQNALAVLLAVALASGDVKKAAKALGKQEAIAGRGKRETLHYGDKANPVTLIDESYNASPASMKAAFRVLALIDPGRGGRRIAVLGDMLELGAHGPKLHADLALPLKAAGVDLVYTCGKLMKNLHDKLPANQRGAHTDTSSELAQIVPDVLVPGDVVMVKGSLGSKMGVVVEALRAFPDRLKTMKRAN